MVRNLFPLALPLCILLLAWKLLPRVPHWSAVHQELLALAPYLLAAVALLSAFHFRRGRVCLLVILSTAGYYLADSHLSAGFDTPQAWLAYGALAVLLPFNLLLVALMREKGIYGTSGRIRMFFLLAQLALVWVTLQQESQSFWNLLSRPLLNLPPSMRVPLPQLSLLLLVTSVLVSLRQVWLRRAPIEGALFGVAISYGILLSLPSVPFVAMVFSGAASLMLVLAIIQDSHNMAFRDDLTGLPSRRALNELLRGLGNRFAIAMVDVDHFKSFNDTYGHDVGDQVLKMVAAKVQEVGGGGRPFRYGGEEFTIVFSGKRAKDVTAHLDRLRQSIADYRMALRSDERPKDDVKGQGRRRGSRRNEQGVSVTVSIGLADSGERRCSVDEVIRAADAALYRAKNSGRNRLCLAGS